MTSLDRRVTVVCMVCGTEFGDVRRPCPTCVGFGNEPSPGIPDVRPPTVTLSRDAAGFAWLALLQVGPDLLTPAQREHARQEVYAALWPEYSDGERLRDEVDS